MTTPEPRGKELPDKAGLWIRGKDIFLVRFGDPILVRRVYENGDVDATLRHASNLPRGGWLPASPPLSDDERETRDEERHRIAKIKRATCEGCLAAAMGLPLHTVAESGYAARSYCGDAWEAGWEFINGSATWKNHAALTAELAQARAEVAEAKNNGSLAERNRLLTALEAIARVDRHRDWNDECIDSKPPFVLADEALAGHKTIMQQRWEWQGEEIQKQIKRAEAAEAERDKYREALRTIQGWDCLTPEPATHLCNDFPWLKSVIDAALAPQAEKPQ